MTWLWIALGLFCGPPLVTGAGGVAAYLAATPTPSPTPTLVVGTAGTSARGD